MILVRFDVIFEGKPRSNLINMNLVQGICLLGKTIEFDLNDGTAYTKHYDTEEEARNAYEKLFTDLASIAGVDGARL